jgi:predicted secreted protein
MKKKLTNAIYVAILVAAILTTAVITGALKTPLALQASGLKGDKGDKGDPGATGPQGPAGLQGARGPAGVAGATGSQGIPGPAGPVGAKGQSTPDFDSGWMNITGKEGQFFNVIHNLNTQDLNLEITGKTLDNGGTHQKFLGLTGYLPGWSRTFGGTANDYGYSIVKTPDNGYAIAGITYASPTSTPDAWLIKTDSNGNVLWNKTYGGTAADYTYNIVQTTDGGFALAGYTQSFGVAQRAVWLLKTDANGNLLWNMTYSGPVDEISQGFVQTADGGYALIGGASPTYFAGGGGTSDLLLIKTDASGNLQWNKTYANETYGNYLSGAGGNLGFTVIQNADGGYVLGSAATLASGAGAHDFVLTKTDSQGNVQWFKTYGGNATDILRALIPTRDAGYAMVGYTNSFGAGGFDIWMVKVNGTGNTQWNKTYGGPLNEMAAWNNVIQASDGGYTIASYTNSYGAGGNDFWLIKTDSYGNMQWSKTYGGVSNDNAFDIVQNNDGSYTMVGNTQSFGASNYDIYLVKTSVEGEAGLAWTDSTTNTLTLYRGANDTYWNYVRVRIWKLQ